MEKFMFNIKESSKKEDYQEVVQALQNFSDGTGEDEPEINFLEFLDYQTGGETQDVIYAIENMILEAYKKLGYDNDKAFEVEECLDAIYLEICDGKFNYEDTLDAIKLFKETFSPIFDQWYYPAQLVRSISILQMIINEDLKDVKFLEIRKYLLTDVFTECRTAYYGMNK